MTYFDIRSASFERLVQFMSRIGEKPFRAQQIFDWIHNKQASDFGEMTNLPLNLRNKLMQIAEFPSIECVQVLQSSDGLTRKYLFQLQKNGIIDNEKVYVEAVLMSYRHGLSLCLSSQAGCRMGCAFCASGLNGLDRHLAAGEIAAQYYQISRDVDKRIGNIVIMGSGEPLDNYDNVLEFIRIITDRRGAALSQRHIALSTCGLVPRIYDLASEKLQITLAISLHAPNDQIRRQIMPIARTYGIEELLAACKVYSTLRRVSFEYIMLNKINDSEANAKELARRLAGISCHINLIPANKIPEKGYNRSSDFAIENFAKTLKKSGFEVTVRRGLGGDIGAACGQLRNDFLNQ